MDIVETAQDKCPVPSEAAGYSLADNRTVQVSVGRQDSRFASSYAVYFVFSQMIEIVENSVQFTLLAYMQAKPK